MKTQAFRAIMLAVLLSFVAIPAFAQAEDLSVSGSDISGAEVGLSVGGGNVNGAETNVSSNPADLSVGGANVNGAETGVITPVSETAPVSENRSSSGSSSSGGSSGSRATFLPTLTSFGQCEYITTYMKLGGNNSVAEVTKLQNFLNSQGFAVAATGIFDVQTEASVKAFQAKYLDEIMLPWGSNTPSGQVYFTTKKKVNEIYCKANFALTAEQIAQIEAYKNAAANGTLNASSTDAETVTGTSSIPLNGEIGSNDNGSQTAAVANTSFFGKVWKFIKGIFGR
jgi:hypothetical protein